MAMKIAIIGAGPAGLFCGALLGRKGHDVIILDKGATPARKLLMAGGGKCNFTNMDVSAANYISSNPHFCKSALSRYTPYDFIDLMQQHRITFHEREHGQLFCDNSSSDILEMLLKECAKGGVKISLNTELTDIEMRDGIFTLKLSTGQLRADSVVVATGGLSIPKSGATPVGYKIAEKFGIPVVPVRAGLVPLTFDQPLKGIFENLAGVSISASVKTPEGIYFNEQMLFTHRGLSGPAILQISNYWRPGGQIIIDLLPDTDIDTFIIEETKRNPRKKAVTVLSYIMPKKLADALGELKIIPDITLDQLTAQARRTMTGNLHGWEIKPNGTEGYRTAEVIVGGVDTAHLSSKTMQAKNTDGLYFIGEVTDVTGWLGGYNLHWCWSSAHACAESILRQISP